MLEALAVRREVRLVPLAQVRIFGENFLEFAGDDFARLLGQRLCEMIQRLPEADKLDVQCGV